MRKAQELRRQRMRFLSIYKTAETGVPPTAEYMATMQRLVEEGMKAVGWSQRRGACRARSARGFARRAAS
jgi:hypothetical protein